MEDPSIPCTIRRSQLRIYISICTSIKLQNFEYFGIPAEMCIAESLNGLLAAQWLVPKQVANKVRPIRDRTRCFIVLCF
jgi:hypothetical protein